MSYFTFVHSKINPHIHVIELNYEQFSISFTGILQKPGIVIKFIIRNLTKLKLLKPFQEDKKTNLP